MYAAKVDSLYELVEYYLGNANERMAFKLENKLHIQVHTHLCMEEQVLSIQLTVEEVLMLLTARHVETGFLLQKR